MHHDVGGSHAHTVSHQSCVQLQKYCKQPVGGRFFPRPCHLTTVISMKHTPPCRNGHPRAHNCGADILLLFLCCHLHSPTFSPLWSASVHTPYVCERRQEKQRPCLILPQHRPAQRRQISPHPSVFLRLPNKHARPQQGHRLWLLIQNPAANTGQLTSSPPPACFLSSVFPQFMKSRVENIVV